MLEGCGLGLLGGDHPYGHLRPHLIETTLANGLRVYMVEDHSAPLVTYQVWMHVGSLHEREKGPSEDHGITGLSHFFEHMMFRGTAKYPDYFDAVYKLGGELNAFTWHDETVFWENIPSEHLREVIAMEADRMEHMKVDFLGLEVEREVVKNERLLRTDNRAEGKAWEVLQSRAFRTFPYQWSTLGRMEDLNSIELEEAQAYHGIHYVPNNTTIFVVGSHDPVQTLAWIKESYQHLAEKPLPPERMEPEPKQEAERRDRIFRPTNPQLVMWAWQAPGSRERDFLILEVLDRILAGGKSARLQQALVYSNPPRLSSLYAYLFPMRYPYIYVWGALPEPGTTTESLQEIMDTELARIAGLPTPPPGPNESTVARGIARLLHVDDTSRLETWQTWLAGGDAPSTELQTMLLTTLFGRDGAPMSDLRAEPAIVSELRALLALLADRLTHQTLPWLHRSRVPLEVHGTYRLNEIMAAFDDVRDGSLYLPREGVYFNANTQCNLLFVTLHKDEDDYSATTMYADYALSPTRFHWQSQSGTRPTDVKGQRHVQHKGTGITPLLFVRERKKDDRNETVPYTFLGPVSLVRAEGERPMNIEWALDTPMPAALLQQAKVVA